MLSCAVFAVAMSPASAQLLPPGATVTRRAMGFGFTEGPLFDANVGAAGSILFTDLNRSDIVRFDIAAGTTAIVDPNSGAANGMFFDAGGHLVSADRDRRQVSRRATSNLTMVETALATQWNGLPFNGPNDLVIDAAGGIYVSDPDYENRRSVPEAIYYINPAGVLSRQLTGFSRPNGVILSPDGGTFYLAAEAQKQIFAFDVAADGSLSNQRLFARTDVNASGGTLPGINNGPDGLTVDAAGNVYAAVQNAVFAWNPAGQRLFSLNVPQDPTNVELGGRNGKTLYITAATSLYSVALNVLPWLPGDFDDDHQVDAADLEVWRAANGQTGAALDADDDGDGAVTASDFLLWQRQLGVGAVDPPQAAAVPEPAALELLSGLALWASCAASAARTFSRGLAPGGRERAPHLNVAVPRRRLAKFSDQRRQFCRQRRAPQLHCNYSSSPACNVATHLRWTLPSNPIG
jgi:gluconolactonase